MRNKCAKSLIWNGYSSAAFRCTAIVDPIWRGQATSELSRAVLATLRIRAELRRKLDFAAGSTGYLGDAPRRAMRAPIISRIRTWFLGGMERLWSQLAPRQEAGGLGAIAVDITQSRRKLVLENAVLRHQVNVFRRRSKRPTLHLVDRLKLLLGARWLPSWRRVIVLVQPETVLRWHRAGFRRF